MSLLHVDFFSNALGEAVNMDVLLPDKPCYPDPAEHRKYPVLYLLHGLSDDHTIWQRRTRIESYLAGKNLVVVMPSTHRAWYTNTVSGLKYFDLVAREIPEFCKANFPIAEGRENTFVAGLSMGGYGALKIALTLPDQFSAAASLSGAMDICASFKRRKSSESINEFVHIFGKPRSVKGSENDVYALADNLLASDAPKPKFYLACGTEDTLLADNRKFKKTYFNKFDMTYEEGPGTHNWDFWDIYIQKVLAWLPIEK